MPSLTPLLALGLTILAVPVLGLALALVQLAVYRLLVRLGRMNAEQIPFFGALLLRGMIAVFVLGALTGLILSSGQRGPAAQVPTTTEDRSR
jgi:hypothetical protein